MAKYSLTPHQRHIAAQVAPLLDQGVFPHLYWGPDENGELKLGFWHSMVNCPLAFLGMWCGHMPTAEDIANLLAYDFLKNGNYSAASGPVEILGLARAIAAADEQDLVPVEDTAGFGGLAIQSVGFEDGVPNPKVHIYLTKGSSKLIKFRSPLPLPHPLIRR